MVALLKGPNLRFVSQDHLTGTSVTTDQNGDTVAGKMTYFPYGATRTTYQTIETEIKFTGQRLDGGVDLYYYGARYYDANIGRFISADTIIPDFTNPQSLNRYSYVFNNPLRYTDPTGHCPFWSCTRKAFTPGPGMGGWPSASGGSMGKTIRGSPYNPRNNLGPSKSEIELQSKLRGTGNSRDPWQGEPPELGWAGTVIAGAIAVGAFVGRTLKGVVSPGGGGDVPVPVENTPPQPRGGVFGNPRDTPSPADSGWGGSEPRSAAGQGAGIIGDIALNPRSSGVGTDEAGNGVALVSIEGGDAIWVTIDNANSMLREGEDLVYIAP